MPNERLQFREATLQFEIKHISRIERYLGANVNIPPPPPPNPVEVHVALQFFLHILVCFN